MEGLEHVTEGAGGVEHNGSSGEIREVSEFSKEGKRELSKETIELFDRLMGYDKIPECGEKLASGQEAENGDKPENRLGLTEEQKEQIREQTGWSEELIDMIGSWEEFELYQKAGLVEVEIAGKKCLVREDIDWEQKDVMGRTNRERAEQGLSPINQEGKVVELHHVGQHSDSPLAELTPEEHRGKGNDTILHDKTKESEIDRQAFSEERAEHWRDRAKEEEWDE